MTEWVTAPMVSCQLALEEWWTVLIGFSPTRTLQMVALIKTIYLGYIVSLMEHVNTSTDTTEEPQQRISVLNEIHIREMKSLISVRANKSERVLTNLEKESSIMKKFIYRSHNQRRREKSFRNLKYICKNIDKYMMLENSASKYLSRLKKSLKSTDCNLQSISNTLQGIISLSKHITSLIRSNFQSLIAQLSAGIFTLVNLTFLSGLATLHQLMRRLLIHNQAISSYIRDKIQ